MDSIANHPSAFRTVQLVNAPLKKSPSKVDLHKPESSVQTPKPLKRTQSKMDVTEPTPKAPASGLKRTQSKVDLTGSNVSRVPSTVRLVPPPRDVLPTTQDGNPSAKRVKRSETDDAATTRPPSRDDQPEAPKPAENQLYVRIASYLLCN